MQIIKPAYAHCDLPCGVYDPVQAKVEAQSVLEIMKKYPDLSPEDKIRAIMIKEKRAEMVKRHLWILWTDYFKPEHLSKYPDLHELFWKAAKQAGLCKKTLDPKAAESLLEQIDAIAKIFWETKKT
jgi:nickel superoxide dismutase